MKKYDVILFDLDGTLTDSALGITTCVQYALHKLGIEVEDRTTLYPFIGPPLLDGFLEYAKLGREQTEQAVGYFRERFSTVGLFENEVYPHVETMLASLKEHGKTVLLATSKPEVFAKKIMEHFGLDGYFDNITGAELDGSRVEKADVIRCALSRANITDCSSVVMVGDRKFDIEGAHEVGIDAIGVLYGYGSRQELETAGAAAIVETVEELRRYLLN